MTGVGWSQIMIPSHEVVERSWPFGTGVKVLGSVGADFTDPLFEWQFQTDASCPKGCKRTMSKGMETCASIKSEENLAFQK